MKHDQKPPQFKTLAEALSHFLSKAKQLEEKYGKTFEELFEWVECSSNWTKEIKDIHSLHQNIQTSKNIIKSRNKRNEKCL